MDLQIEYININEIKPYEKNPRKNGAAVEKVMKSIQSFGFKVPIVLDKGKTVIAGHTRLLAAQTLKLEKVPAIIADDLTDAKAKAFRLADNKVSEFSAWDFGKLEEELSELACISDIDMSEFGFGDISADVNIDDFFVEHTEEKEKPPKTYTCPHCGKIFEVEQ